MVFPLKILLDGAVWTSPKSTKGVGGYFRTFWVGMCRWDPETFSLYQTYNHGQKSCVSGASSNSHKSNPSPHPTNNVARVFIQNFFLSTLYRVGGSENCKTIPKRMHCFKREPRNDRKIGILQYSPKDKLHVYKLFFTGNVSNAIRFWSRRLIACVQTPPPFRFLLKGRGLYAG